jgi:hypothetical protein
MGCVLFDANLPVQRECLGRVIAENNFCFMRDFQDYRDGLGSPFIWKLRSLKRGQSWMDWGAGAAVAMIEHAEGTYPSLFDRLFDHSAIEHFKRLNYYAVSPVRPTWKPLDRIIQDPRFDHFKYIQKKVQGVSLDDIGGRPVELITDFKGAMSYDDPSEVLEKADSLLAVDGVLVTVFSPRAFLIVDGRGNVIPIRKWLEATEGLKLESMENVVIEEQDRQMVWQVALRRVPGRVRPPLLRPSRIVGVARDVIPLQIWVWEASGAAAN